MITNDNGEIAVRYSQSTQKYVSVGGIGYVFVVKYNISMAWIRPEHVNTVLRMTKECCGGRKHKMFTATDQTHVDRWLGLKSR
jgi:hypothetical protein